MSADTQQLIQQSLQGDQRAFGQIVERYQGAVSAMAYSVTGNLAQSEDLAQEAFIIAWKKLGALQKHESLSAWLCGIARNLARDWMRTQAARPTISMEHLDETAQPLGESPEATQQRRERADLVWSALAEIPENYREPLILFYRQGESIRDIAEALELSEDNVKQRLSRGRKLLRAEVARTVEDTLADTRPGKAFTAGVLAALPALYGAKAGAAEVASTSAKAVAGPAAMGALIKIALPVAAVVGMVLGGVWLTQNYLEAGEGTRSSATTDSGTVSYSQVPARSDRDAENVPAFVNALTAVPTIPEVAPVDGTTSISGITRFRDTGEPAPAMRIVAKEPDDTRHEAISDAAGRYRFSNLASSEYTLFAFDARHIEVPWKALRSEDYPATLSGEGSLLDLDIEVPRTGVLRGQITDLRSGEPIGGIRVEVTRMGGGGIPFGISDARGNYQVAGVQKGTSLVSLGHVNPVFVSETINTMETITVGDDLTATVNISVERGVPVSGYVVDTEGNTVVDALVDADLSLGETRQKREKLWSMSCQTRVDSKGQFTLWGGQHGDKIVVSARKGDRASHIAVVSLETDASPQSTTLTLLPKVAVSGRFVDEQGRPIKAQLWYRPVQVDGAGPWLGLSEEHDSTFTAALAQGKFELKGRLEPHDNQIEPLTTEVTIGAEPVDGVVVNVLTAGELTGPHTLTGRVVDEQGRPIPECRVGINGSSRSNSRANVTLRADRAGKFTFSGLLDDVYRIVAYPGIPYEKGAMLEGINPIETPEVTIVVRRAATLQGNVLDAASGKPISQFELDYGELGIFGRETSWGPDTPSVHSTSGAFSFPARPDIEWYLRVSARGYASQRLTGPILTSGEVSELLVVSLSPNSILRGTVVRSDGKPLPGALIFAKDLDIGQRRGSDNADTESDANGAFILSSIPEDAEFIHVQMDGFANARVSIAEEMRVVLYDGGVIEGRITVGGGLPEGEVMVAAMALDVPLAEAAAETILGARDVKFAKVAEDGSYRLEHLMDLAYQIQITTNGGTLGIRRILPAERLHAANGALITFDVDIPWGGAVVEGVVTAGGQPIAGAQLSCANGDAQIVTISGAEGEYRFEGLVTGPATIAVVRPNRELQGSAPLITSETALELSGDEIVKHDIDL